MTDNLHKTLCVKSTAAAVVATSDQPTADSQLALSRNAAGSGGRVGGGGGGAPRGDDGPVPPLEAGLPTAPAPACLALSHRWC